MQFYEIVGEGNEIVEEPAQISNYSRSLLHEAEWPGMADKETEHSKTPFIARVFMSISGSSQNTFPDIDFAEEGWGNHSSTQYPDVNHATVKTPSGEKPVRELVADDEWLNTEFISTVQQRGAAIIKARKQSSALSAASSACDHIRDWVLGTPEGTFVSMGVYSDGSYGVPAGLIYSFPVTCSGGEWTIVQGLPIDEFSRKKMDATAQELSEEKTLAYSCLN